MSLLSWAPSPGPDPAAPVRPVSAPAAGVSLAGLWAAHDLPAPSLPPAPPPSRGRRRPRRRDSDDAGPRFPVRGRAARGHGWSALAPQLTAYRATTAQAGGLFPWMASEGVAPTGAYVGPDFLSGGGFYAHPVEWLRRGMVTNPNVMLFGEPGKGKSTVVKALALRLSAFGVRTFIAGDSKDEYEPLVAAMGCTPIALGLGLPTRLNPLDAGPLGEVRGLSAAAAADRAAEVQARRLVLLRGLLAARGYDTNPTDDTALSAALRAVTGMAAGASVLATPTIPRLWTALAHPDAALVDALRVGGDAEAVELTRHLTDALGSLVHGALAGLFDAPTNVAVDFAAPIQSVSLSRLTGRGEQAVAVAMACVGAWAQAATDVRRPGEVAMIVRDELWRVMRLGPAMVKAVDAELRLSRSEGKIVVLAQHKPSDLLGVGDSGSQAVNIAKDLISLADTRIMLGQSAGVTADLAAALGLTTREQEEITGWANGARGRALWKVGQRTFKVQAWLASAERALYETDAGILAERAGPAPVPVAAPVPPAGALRAGSIPTRPLVVPR